MSSDFSTPAAPVPLGAFASAGEASGAARRHPPGPVPGDHAVLQHAPGVSLGGALEALRSTQRALGLPAAIEAKPVGSAAEFAASLGSEPILIAGGDHCGLHRAGHSLRELHPPITILSTLPSAGVGALLALMLFRQDSRPHLADRHHPADRHRQEERAS